MSPALSDYSHVTSWSKADKALGGDSSKFIGNNTKLVKASSGDIYVLLHGNKVVKFEKSTGLIQLSSAGHRTSTTKDRLNRYTPSNVHVTQEDFTWYLEKGGSREKFSDGMKVRA